MTRTAMLGLGGILVIVGVIWTLQGLNLLGGSGGMNGVAIWAIIGPLVAVGGGVLIFLSRRRRP